LLNKKIFLNQEFK